MDVGPTLLVGVLGVVAGVFGCWWLTGSYYQQPSAREKQLWQQITELQALMEVPPLFWQIWARYLHELSPDENDDKPHGKHATGNPTSAHQTPQDIPRPRDERG